MKVVCSFCNPPRIFGEEEPLTDEHEIDGICPDCYQKLADEENIPLATIPERLGKCNIIKIHDDGDLSIKCAGKNYIITTEGSVFREIMETEV